MLDRFLTANLQDIFDKIPKPDTGTAIFQAYIFEEIIFPTGTKYIGLFEIFSAGIGKFFRF
jgi:hypothetical protein